MSTQIEETKYTGGTREDTVLPPTDTDPIKKVEDFLATYSQGAALVADTERILLPDEVHRALKRVVEALARGQAVTVAPVDMQLTTSQAADMLGVSRQTLIRLLEDKVLPYEQPRRHRLLRLSDVLAYRERRHVETRMTLADMTRQAVEDGLYDDSYEDYEEALKLARKGEISQVSV